MVSGAPGMPTSDPRLTRSIADVADQCGLVGDAGDQPRRGQIQRGVHGVSDAHIQRAGLAGHDDRGAPDVTSWLQEREDRAHRDRDGRQNTSGDQRKRLCA